MVYGVVFSVVLCGCGLYDMVMGSMWCIYMYYIVYMYRVYGIVCGCVL